MGGLHARSGSLAARARLAVGAALFGVGCYAATADSAPAAGDAGQPTEGGGDLGDTSGETSGTPKRTPTPDSDSGSGPVGEGSTGPCCDPHGEQGCSDPFIADCVCASDRYCCEVAWDQTCVDRIGEHGCGSCIDPNRPPGDCCTPGEAAGCNDPEIEACVCAIDAFCCLEQWDALCVDLSLDALCGVCDDEAGEDSGRAPQGDSCCTSHPTQGCDDTEIEGCVCDVLPSCCADGWTSACVDAVTVFECGVCRVPGSLDEACCRPSVRPGCSDPSIAACVCGEDPFCCEVAWDELCAAAAGACGGCAAPLWRPTHPDTRARTGC